MTRGNWSEVWESGAVTNGGADRSKSAKANDVAVVEAEGQDMFAQAGVAAE